MDVPRRLPPSHEQRLRTLATRSGAGTARGLTAWGRNSGNGTTPGVVTNGTAAVAGADVPAGSTDYTVETADFFGETINVYVAPDSALDGAVVFAAMLPDDVYPRWVFAADSEAGIYFGDGVNDVNPINMCNLYLAESGTLGVIADEVQFSGDVVAARVVMPSPDGSYWEVTVTDGGTLNVTPR